MSGGFDEDAVIEALARLEPRLVAIELRLTQLESAPTLVAEVPNYWAVGYPNLPLQEFVPKLL